MDLARLQRHLADFVAATGKAMGADGARTTPAAVLARQATTYVNEKLAAEHEAPVSLTLVRRQLEIATAEQVSRGAAGAAFLGSSPARAPARADKPGGKANARAKSTIKSNANGKSRGKTPLHPRMFDGESAARTARAPTRTPSAAAPQGALVAAQQAADPSVTEVFAAPTSRTSVTVRFEVPDSNGKEINPGERWLFEVPSDLRGAAIRSVVLAHRKDEKYQGSVVDGHDNEAAYDLVTARNAQSKEWVAWHDEYGSKKFAEPRGSYNPENENLHDWLAAVGAVPVDMLAVTNVGVGARAIANVHFVEIEFFPPGKIESRAQEIFTAGTAFVDLEHGVTRPTYGGGMGAHLSPADVQRTGLYPNAVELSGWGGASRKLSEHAYIRDGELHVALPAGKKLGNFEIAVGDTRLDTARPIAEKRNKDGH